MEAARFYETSEYCVRVGVNVRTGHTQKNGAVSIGITIETAPLFCVCPVYDCNTRTYVC